MFTVGELAKKYQLSRSTLLYYERIKLLIPNGRSDANYRLYNDADIEKMEKILIYKNAGLSILSISEIIDSPAPDAAKLLEKKLESLNFKMNQIRQQQQFIVSLLGKGSLIRSTRTMSKTQWVDILRASGMNDDDMHQWHIEFERSLPEMHTDFLESLGLGSEEIEKIKIWSNAHA